jgi:hypothetical protein
MPAARGQADRLQRMENAWRACYSISMTLSYSSLLSACAITGSLLLAGCDKPADDLPTSPQPPARTERGPTGNDRAAVAADAQRQQADKPAGEPAPHAPLDLSMPAQPEVEFGSLEGNTPPTQRLLPDLFGDTVKPDQGAVRLKGRVFMPDTEPEDYDTVDGGQVTIELKTR